MNRISRLRKERRSSPRTEQPLRVLISDPCDALDDPFPALITDRSQGGVCLSVGRQEIEEGTILTVLPLENGYGRYFEVRVTNRRQDASSVQLGCAFVKN